MRPGNYAHERVYEDGLISFIRTEHKRNRYYRIRGDWSVVVLTRAQATIYDHLCSRMDDDRLCKLTVLNEIKYSWKSIECLMKKKAIQYLDMGIYVC